MHSSYFNLRNALVLITILIFSPNFCFSDEVILDEFNGTSLGTPFGIEFVDTPNGQGAIFVQEKESRIQYDFNAIIPTQGTLEFFIKVESGYKYYNYELSKDMEYALIFTTDIQGGDTTWPGSTWLYVNNNGNIGLHMAVDKYGELPKQSVAAEGTDFKFGEWHAIGISYGSEGQHIMLDGTIVASEPSNTQILGRGGNHSSPLDIPTIGESVSCFWKNNQYEGGFEGVLDTFRVSNSQLDWVVSSEKPCICEGLYTQDEVDKLINNILDWDKNKDGHIGLIEAIHLIKESAGIDK